MDSSMKNILISNTLRALININKRRTNDTPDIYIKRYMKVIKVMFRLKTLNK
jgi:hypothetical protein